MRTPKTGGTSLGRALGNKFKLSAKYNCNASIRAKLYSKLRKLDSFDSMGDDNYRMHGVVELAAALEAHSTIRFIKGHFFYNPILEDLSKP